MTKRDEIKSRLAQQLRRIREKRGMTLEQVALKMNWNNYQTLSSIENGTRDIKARELSRLARIYGKSMEYFLTEPQNDDKAKVLWRAKGNNRQAEVVEDWFIDCLRTYIKLERINNDVKRFPAQRLQREDVNWKWIDGQANNYADKLGSRPARALELVLERKFGVKIFSFSLSGVGSGASTMMDGHAGLLVNSEEVPWRRNFNLAHELFHLITWDVFSQDEIHCGASGDKPQVEKFADGFAAALLMPTEEVLSEYLGRVNNNKISSLDLVLLALEFGVSTQALLWRLANLHCLNKGDVTKLISNEDFLQLNKNKRTGKWHKQQPYSHRFVELGFRAMIKGHLSRAKFAQYLNVPLPNLSEFLIDYGLLEDEDYSVEINTT